ncbi:hypothetical protein J2Z34_001990 [Youngiibacter multivorans]|uniref:NusG domain II-containing protein n=2 Tax=Youngiibacter multivorans TaxID=937251 RepID=A0ABS4G4N5_9CLOT|nr:hypothetical protein [Youngiibacter multivorans]
MIMKVKKWDIIIIALFVLLSFVPVGIFAMTVAGNEEADGVYAVVTVQGEEYKTIKLTGHTGNEDILVKTDLGMNLLQIVDGKVMMFEADCPDQVCVYQGAASKPGDTIVCLPHKVVVEIKGTVPDEDQTDITTN